MRRYSLYLLILSLLCMSCNRKVYMFSSFHEPANEGLRLMYSKDGYRWNDLNKIFLKPAVDEKIMRDPSIIQGPDGMFHLVFTSAWHGKKGFGYASSNDLIHWSEQRIIDVMQQDSTTVNIWAPELFYDDQRKDYIIIWASTIPFKFPRGIEEENNNHRMYYTTTKDFVNFTPTKLFLDPGFSVIDATIVQRAEKDYVFVLKDNTRPERNLKVAFAKDPLGPYGNISAPFTDNFTEGPTVVKVKKNWLIYFDSYRKKIYDAVSTKDFKTFTPVTDKIELPEGHKHGTIFETSNKVLKKLIKSSQ